MHLHFSCALRPPCPPNIPYYICKSPDKSVSSSALGHISPFWCQSCTLLFAPSWQMHFFSLLAGIWFTNLHIKKGRKVAWGLSTCFCTYLCLLTGLKRSLSTVTSSSSCFYVVSVLFCPLCLKSELSLWQTELDQKGTWLNLWKKHGSWVQATCSDLFLPWVPAIRHPEHVTWAYLAAFSLPAKQGSNIFYSTSMSWDGMSPAFFETLVN